MCIYTYVYIYLLQTMVSTTIPEYKLKLHGVHSSSFLLTYFCGTWVLWDDPFVHCEDVSLLRYLLIGLRKS